MRVERLALLALVAAAPAAPDNFYNRVGAGNLVFATPDGAAYAKAYAPLVRAAVQACLPPGKVGGTFTYVADVARTGALRNSAARPVTFFSRCFAAHFEQNTLPPPPLPSYAKIDYPLAIELDLNP